MTNGELAAYLLSELEKRSFKFAVAESLTGGMLSANFVNIPGASRVYQGAVVAYQTEIKSSILGVDANFLAEYGPYNEQTAIQMATGVRQSLSADIGIATTGVAGPLPEGDIPAGTFFVAVAGEGGQSSARSYSISGTRGQIREAACRLAMELLRDTLS
ncbi:CinA family protein [Actinomycetaceae bacterium TAE3-ERU4]|nr:CinA family protein [Actinomycetaceae bacterium TAE3-ERU4]